jgi:hypothetical protein
LGARADARIRQWQAASGFGTPTGPHMADGQARTGLTRWRRRFEACENLNFGEREARDAVRAHEGNDGGVESLMRSARARLTRNSCDKAS